MNQPCTYTKFEVRRRRHTFGFSINQPGDLDISPGNWYALLPVRWTTFLPISGFLGLCILHLWANTCQTHQVTLRHWPVALEVMHGSCHAVIGLRVLFLHLCTNKFVGLSFRKIWMTHFRSQHLSTWWPWLLTLKLVRITAHEVDNLNPTNLIGVSRTFSTYRPTPVRRIMAFPRSLFICCYQQ